MGVVTNLTVIRNWRGFDLNGAGKAMTSPTVAPAISELPERRDLPGDPPPPPLNLTIMLLLGFLP